MIDLAKLKAPFAPERVSWRIGSTNSEKTKGMALAYLDARDVMERLDEVCGVAGWQCSYPHANGKTVCAISIKVGDEWISKEDGAGDTDVEKEKGALSDAFKRAAVRWGVGRYLYDMPSPWVAIEQRGRSYIIKDSEYTRLAAALSKGVPATPAPPSEAFTRLKSEVAHIQTQVGLKTWAENVAVAPVTDGERQELRSLYKARVAVVSQAERTAA